MININKIQTDAIRRTWHRKGSSWRAIVCLYMQDTQYMSKTYVKLYLTTIVFSIQTLILYLNFGNFFLLDNSTVTIMREGDFSILVLHVKETNQYHWVTRLIANFGNLRQTVIANNGTTGANPHMKNKWDYELSISKLPFNSSPHPKVQKVYICNQGCDYSQCSTG